MSATRVLVITMGLPVLCGCSPRPTFGGHVLYGSVRRASVSVLSNGGHVGAALFAATDGLIVTSAHMVKGKTALFSHTPSGTAAGPTAAPQAPMAEWRLDDGQILCGSAPCAGVGRGGRS